VRNWRQLTGTAPAALRASTPPRPGMPATLLSTQQASLCSPWWWLCRGVDGQSKVKQQMRGMLSSKSFECARGSGTLNGQSKPPNRRALRAWTTWDPQ
jgi:hypothetical protein